MNNDDDIFDLGGPEQRARLRAEREALGAGVGETPLSSGPIENPTAGPPALSVPNPHHRTSTRTAAGSGAWVTDQGPTVPLHRR
jgi:hypothetical protein